MLQDRDDSVRLIAPAPDYEPRCTDRKRIFEESMSQKSLVSVVLYQNTHGILLHDTIYSILQQSHHKVEILIIDPQRGDTCQTIARTFNDNRIRFIRSAYRAEKNLVIKHAFGRYITGITQGDISLPERFTSQVRFLETNPNIAACGTSIRIIDPLYNFKVRRMYPTTYSEIRCSSFFQLPVFKSAVMFDRTRMEPEDIAACLTTLSHGGSQSWAKAISQYEFSNLPNVLLLHTVIDSGNTSSDHSGLDEICFIDRRVGDLVPNATGEELKIHRSIIFSPDPREDESAILEKVRWLCKLKHFAKVQPRLCPPGFGSFLGKLTTEILIRTPSVRHIICACHCGNFDLFRFLQAALTGSLEIRSRMRNMLKRAKRHIVSAGRQ
jgi:hypothetical protein